jgi:hypothetical protein
MIHGVSIYLWIGLASVALVLISIVASLRKYLTGLGLKYFLGGKFPLQYFVSRLFRRDRNRTRSIRLTIDGDTLELTHATAEDQERLINLWLSRNNPPADGDAK